MANLKQKTLSGISWNAFSSIINQISGYVISILLARLLDPSDFGLMALVVVVIGFGKLLKDIGLGEALIQKLDITEEQRSSIFWMNIGLGFLLGAITIVFAPMLARSFEEPKLELLLQVASLNFVVTSLVSTHSALLRKKLAFKEVAIVNMLATIIAGVAAVILAFGGAGVWALVLKSLIASFVSLLVVWHFYRWIPKFTFNWKEVKSFLKFGLNLAGSKIFAYWTRQLDNVLVGKYMGSASLGYYSIAYKFLLKPLSAIKVQISNVLFPVMSKVGKDFPRQQNLYLKATSALCLVMFPISIGLFYVSEDFVLLLLGKKWESIIPLMKVFSLTSFFEGLGFPGVIFLSQGLANRLFRINLFTRTSMLLFIVIGIFTGELIYVAIGAAAGLILHILVLNFLSLPVIELKIGRLLKVIFPFFIATIAMFSFLVSLEFLFLKDFSLLTRFILKVLLGSIFYGTFLILFKPSPVEDALTFIQEKWLKFRRK